MHEAICVAKRLAGGPQIQHCDQLPPLAMLCLRKYSCVHACVSAAGTPSLCTASVQLPLKVLHLRSMGVLSYRVTLSHCVSLVAHQNGRVGAYSA